MIRLKLDGLFQGENLGSAVHNITALLTNTAIVVSGGQLTLQDHRKAQQATQRFGRLQNTVALAAAQGLHDYVRGFDYYIPRSNPAT
jgi:hypothetical protein